MKKNTKGTIPTTIFLAVLVNAFQVLAANTNNEVKYFKCVVKETYGANEEKSKDIKVFFAIKGLKTYEGKGELLQYPGAEEEGSIKVRPLQFPNSDQSTRMTNLNGQGGDLRVENSGIRLFGDGAGYQFTDLVVWEDGDGEFTEGYVRDYGPTYGDQETFKRFIKCETSDSPY